MRGFEETESKAKATLDDVLTSLEALNNNVIKLVETLAPAKEEIKTEDKEIIEE